MEPRTDHIDDADDADAMEQAQPVTENEGWETPHTGVEVPEADAVEQAIEVSYDDDEPR